jgi:hypothetical protein
MCPATGELSLVKARRTGLNNIYTSQFYYTSAPHKYALPIELARAPGAD